MDLAVEGAEFGPVPLVSHFWQKTPKLQLHQMSDLLEAGQAALVVVAVDHTEHEIAALLPKATVVIVSESTATDFGFRCSNAAAAPNDSATCQPGDR